MGRRSESPRRRHSLDQHGGRTRFESQFETYARRSAPEERKTEARQKRAGGGLQPSPRHTDDHQRSLQPSPTSSLHPFGVPSAPSSPSLAVRDSQRYVQSATGGAIPGPKVALITWRTHTTFTTPTPTTLTTLTPNTTNPTPTPTKLYNTTHTLLTHNTNTTTPTPTTHTTPSTTTPTHTTLSTLTPTPTQTSHNQQCKKLTVQNKL